jgi:serine/threonine protein kinase
MPDQAQSLVSLIGLEFSHYRIIEEIGSGGMGVVYRARDTHLEREVAIKVLTPRTITDEAARKHLRKEALALS